MVVDVELYLAQLEESVQFLNDQFGSAPSTGFVLGSGLGDFVDELDQVKTCPYSEIPHFPLSKVVGHSGKFSVAPHGQSTFCALRGRLHLYEGSSSAEVVFAVRATGLWGVRVFVITNAAGGINRQLQAGDLMLIKDHISLLGDNPLRGSNLDSLGERFPDMSEAYDRSLLTLARQCGKELDLNLKEGIYVALPGPSYETPAEIQMCRVLGADAVGMSTVPEVVALNHMQKKVLGVSCISNMAAGILPRKLNHQEVLETTRRVKKEFASLLLKIVEKG